MLRFSKVSVFYLCGTFLFLSVLISFCSLEAAAQEEMTPVPVTRSNCRKFVMILAKRLMKYLNGCIKELKAEHPGKEGYSKYFDCSLKCALGKIDMINVDAQFSNETFTKFVTTHIPKHYYPLVYFITGRCTKVFDTVITGKDDPYCKTYGNLIKCYQEDLSEHC